LSPTWFCMPTETTTWAPRVRSGSSPGDAAGTGGETWAAA